MGFQQMKAIRKAAGITQAELAQRLKVNRATLSKYETGAIDLPTSKLQIVAKALGVRVQDLIGGEADLNQKEVEEMIIDTAKVEILMAEQGLNQKELGERCGMPRQNISAIIRRGKAEPKTVGKLAGGLGVAVKELIAQEEVAVPKPLEMEVTDMMRGVEVAGTFPVKTFFETLAVILSRKYGKEISVTVTETGNYAATGNEVTERPGA